MIRRPPRSPLFPSPPLFGSERGSTEAGASPARPRHCDGHVGAQHAAPAARRHWETGKADRTPEARDRKSTRLNSSHSQISYAVFCLKKKKKKKAQDHVQK